MFGKWLGEWLEKKVIEWLAKKLGVSPIFLKGALDTIITFLKEIFSAFDGKDASPQDAKLFLQKFNARAKAVSSNRTRQTLEKVLLEI